MSRVKYSHAEKLLDLPLELHPDLCGPVCVLCAFAIGCGQLVLFLAVY